jgi:hypothetical protein
VHSPMLVIRKLFRECNSCIVFRIPYSCCKFTRYSTAGIVQMGGEPLQSLCRTVH